MNEPGHVVGTVTSELLDRQIVVRLAPEAKDFSVLQTADTDSWASAAWGSSAARKAADMNNWSYAFTPSYMPSRRNQEMPIVIQYRMYCLPVCYPKR